MPSDLTIAEKAEKLGLEWFGRAQGDNIWRPKHRASADYPCYRDTDIDALYAERFPAPDYRAALEGLVLAIDRGDGDAYRLALTHARKVLHGQ